MAAWLAAVIVFIPRFETRVLAILAAVFFLFFHDQIAAMVRQAVAALF